MTTHATFIAALLRRSSDPTVRQIGERARELDARDGRALARVAVACVLERSDVVSTIGRGLDVAEALAGLADELSGRKVQ